MSDAKKQDAAKVETDKSTTKPLDNKDKTAKATPQVKDQVPDPKTESPDVDKKDESADKNEAEGEEGEGDGEKGEEEEKEVENGELDDINSDEGKENMPVRLRCRRLWRGCCCCFLCCCKCLRKTEEEEKYAKESKAARDAKSAIAKLMGLNLKSDVKFSQLLALVGLTFLTMTISSGINIQTVVVLTDDIDGSN